MENGGANHAIGKFGNTPGERSLSPYPLHTCLQCGRIVDTVVMYLSINSGGPEDICELVVDVPVE